MIYVANRLSDKVTVIDGRSNVAVQPIGGEK
jgi:YVTN family beta-propeller protein